MQITSVSIQKEEKENSRMIGYAEIVFDNCLKVNGIRIVKIVLKKHKLGKSIYPISRFII